MKSMITVLWERSKRKKQVEERLKSSGRNSKPESDYSFKIETGGTDGDSSSGGLILADDTTLEYRRGSDCSLDADYGVYLAGNWRFELGIDSGTGRCVGIKVFLSKLTAKNRALEIPDAEPGQLIFESDDMASGACDYVDSPNNSVYFDPVKKTMCIGDPDVMADAVEFGKQAVAVVKSGKLAAVYLDLSDLKNEHGTCCSVMELEYINLV